MQETVKFDLLGDRRIVFDDEGVTDITEEMYPVPLPGLMVTATVTRNRPIPYDDIHRVGLVHRRQWWALGLGALFTPIGLLGMTGSGGDRGAFYVGAVFLLLLGLFPLWLLARGRKFLTIASDQHVICLPMDRNKRQVRRVIALQKESLESRRVRWEMEVAS